MFKKFDGIYTKRHDYAREWKRERSFEEDFGRNGIRGLNGIFLKNLERIQELPEHLLSKLSLCF
jgi:hypothetical protein